MATRPGNRIVDEQATLRRVATLVAGGASPEAVFAVVAEEVGRLLGADLTMVGRYDPDGTVTAVGAWSDAGAALPEPGTGTRLGGRNTATLVFRSHRPVRIDDDADASGPPSETGHGWGWRSAVGAPISIEGRLWGVMTVASTRGEALPADTDGRLADFTQLVATAIANAQARVELRRFADEEAALRRVATLVAQAAPADVVFAAVTAEIGRVLSADLSVLNRFEPDGTETVVGVWSRTGPGPVPVGTRVRLGAWPLSTLVYRTDRPARIEDYADLPGPAAELARQAGIRASVGVPVNVHGRLWGAVIVASAAALAPETTEERLAAFTELVATTIANAQAGTELREFADQQAALRRVATLVARAAPPEEVFGAVTAEVGRVFTADAALMSRYGPDGTATIVSAWTSSGSAPPIPVGRGFELGGRNVHTLVFHTGRPARTSHAEASGAAADVFGGQGIRAAVGAPIGVEGRLWGVMTVLSTHGVTLPVDTEVRLADFTDLVATALAEAETQAALTASRARIVATADATRRRVERDLHDGAQQRLVSLALHLRGTVRAAVPPEAAELTARLDAVATEMTGVLEDLRELARGLHPAALADGGLRPALKALARRSAVPVRLDVRVDGRLPDPIELAAYYTVAETLSNSARHAGATVVDVDAETSDRVLRVLVRDDGRGGADPTRGSGLVELTDRVEALGGRLSLLSPPGLGTTVQISLPLPASGRPESPAAVT